MGACVQLFSSRANYLERLVCLYDGTRGQLNVIRHLLPNPCISEGDQFPKLYRSFISLCHRVCAARELCYSITITLLKKNIVTVSTPPEVS